MIDSWPNSAKSCPCAGHCFTSFAVVLAPATLGGLGVVTIRPRTVVMPSVVPDRENQSGTMHAFYAEVFKYPSDISTCWPSQVADVDTK